MTADRGTRGVLHRTAGALWDGDLGLRGRLLSVGLVPLSVAWRAGVWWRNRRFDRRVPAAVPGVRIVSVGNLAVGGTGKTPFSSWVAGVITDAGRPVAIVRRDYGDDETGLHRQWRPGMPVLSGSDRVQLTADARDAGAEVVVLDDGFQHRALGRDLDLVLLAVEDGLSQPLLPRGRFREPMSAVARADAVVLTRRHASPERARAMAAAIDAHPACAPVKGCVRLTPGRLRSLTDPTVAAPDRTLDSPLVVTGVARPREVLRDVASLCTGTATLMAFPDHHAFDATDVERIRVAAGPGPVVVTEKDAVKLRALGDLSGPTWVLGQELIWDWGLGDVTALLSDLAPAVTR